MTRVAIIGNAGGGKSTLCFQLGKFLSLPVYSIDKFQWIPGWIPASAEEFRQKHEEVLALDRWIIDGWGSWSAIEARFLAADTIIIVDHPLFIHYWWTIKRQFKYIFRTRLDGPEGCPMLPMTGKLLRMIWDIHHQGRPQLLQLVETFRGTRQIIYITSPRQLQVFLQTYSYQQAT